MNAKDSLIKYGDKVHVPKRDDVTGMYHTEEITVTSIGSVSVPCCDINDFHRYNVSRRVVGGTDLKGVFTMLTFYYRSVEECNKIIEMANNLATRNNT